MGREALVHAEVGDQAGEVRALLESTEMILRGSIKRRISRSTIEKPVADQGVLQFRHGEELIRLHLGNRMAQSWTTALLAPPPTLRAKLGLDRGAKALLTALATTPSWARPLRMRSPRIDRKWRC